MPRVPSSRRVRIAALITLVFLLALSGSEVMKWPGRPYQLDFKVYLTAAKLVREHKSLDIYNDADTGQNPQTRYAAKDSTFQAAATELGIPAIWLYVYPPTLADMLVPLTYLSLQHACDAWLAVNVLTVVFSAMLLAWLVYESASGLACVGIFLGMLCFRSNIWGFGQGQICCVLLLLWVAGIVFYLKGYKRTSAALFALATAIKLTPLLVLLPMLIWREWKWARWYGISLCVLLAGLLVVNGPATLADYVLHVMPPMSVGFLSLANISIPSGLQQLYEGIRGGAFQGEHASAPAAVALGAKAIAAAVMLAAMVWIYKLGPGRSVMERAKMLSMVALLSLYCSPVAWRSAYGVVFLLAFFLWRDAFEFGASKMELLLLVLCTLEFSFFFDTILIRFAHGVLLSTTALIAPFLGCVLIFTTLRKMQRSAATHTSPNGALV
jgi:hypothetical protein